MNVIKNQDKRIAIAVSEAEARHILEGLIRHADDLGSAATSLHEQLEGVGIAPPPPPDHIRHEF